MRRSRLGAGLALLVVAVLAMLVAPNAALRRLAWVAADPLRFGVALFVLALVRPLVAWPTTLLAVGVGYGYGTVGLPYALALITLTCVPPFLVARHVGRESWVASAGEQFVAEAGGLRSVVASRFVPAPSDIVSVAAGVSGVSLSSFVVGTAIGELPWAVVGVLAGASLDSLADASLDSLDLRLVVAMALAAALLAAGPLYRVLFEGDSAVADVDAKGK